MNRDQVNRMARGAGLLIAAVLFVFLVLWSIGCTTTETVYERVEIPVPYWEEPEDIAPAPPRPNLQAGDISRDEAEADPREAFRVLGQDLDASLAWGEHLLHLYLELVKRIRFDPAVSPPSDGDGASPGG